MKKMKKMKWVPAIAFALCFAASMTACKSGKSCKGGGWYGNRNLSCQPSEKQDAEEKVKTLYSDNEAACLEGR